MNFLKQTVLIVLSLLLSCTEDESSNTKKQEPKEELSLSKADRSEITDEPNKDEDQLD
mgnify:FL=1